MKKEQFKDESVAATDEQVRQLIRIARLESEQPLEGCRTLVFGASPQAKSLYETLKRQCVAVRMAASVAELQENDGRFELAIILEPISHRVLENLMSVGGVAIDANVQRSGEWVMYDKTLNFKRIRVLSLLGRPANDA
ncbi:MAG: hypothetical protein VB035_03565 [Candidatus Fimivivens sp.]|nr:hypothetical protein [Candidatus Fimivivens sp.]